MSGWLVAFMVDRWCMEVTKMTKIENVGMQCVICGNLVCD